MVTLMIAAAVFIGRIDTPFLAPEVGRIGSFEFDNYHTFTAKAFLRVRLTVTHTLKRGGRVLDEASLRFGKTAGASWRLFFVYALMPWLQK